MSDKTTYTLQQEMFIPIILHLLVDLNARQLSMQKVIAEILEESGVSSSFENILQRVETGMKFGRSHYVKHLYAEFGELDPGIKKMFDQAFGNEK